MEWSTDGEILAVIQDKTGTIYFWDTYTRKLEQQVETNLKQLNSLKWSLKGDIVKNSEISLYFTNLNYVTSASYLWVLPREICFCMIANLGKRSRSWASILDPSFVSVGAVRICLHVVPKIVHSP